MLDRPQRADRSFRCSANERRVLQAGFRPLSFAIMPFMITPIIRTSPLMRLNAQAGWARTYSRFFRLGVPLAKVVSGSRATFLAAAATKGFNRSPPDDVVEGMRHNRDLILKNVALFS